jgi:hypothetical protein
MPQTATSIVCTDDARFEYEHRRTKHRLGINPKPFSGDNSFRRTCFLILAQTRLLARSGASDTGACRESNSPRNQSMTPRNCSNRLPTVSLSNEIGGNLSPLEPTEFLRSGLFYAATLGVSPDRQSYLSCSNPRSRTFAPPYNA